MTQTITQRVQRAFSKAAVHYDQLATLQQSVGFRLLKTIAHEKPQSILDIGMGTGALTENLCAQFPNAEIFGMDFSDGMIEYARKRNPYFRIIQADARKLPFKENTFDMVVSNLAYQWVDDLSGAFERVFNVLKDGGAFYLSSFGPQTLGELFSSIEGSGMKGMERSSFSAAKMSGKEDIANAVMHSGFCDFQVKTETMKAYFPAATVLLKWLKTIGANTAGKNLFVGKKQLTGINDFYAKNFSDDKGRIYATFEVVWARARK
ncbi:MAG TPA: methyltransferase domain-containing protein [Candidatus Omnitrophota bacterium]|nr:methyltransferase domain-containing protein [Candidatus Omnitrophota bacterium]HPD84678.1 methyltransferase domain-containing protein [Candidatus Omnitrophota bacterium]HRZ03536.1 methyltransferase domain-containing protein [Candidatus Omnitrophota bacterium]